VTAAEVTHLHTARLRRAAVHGDGNAALILAYRAERDAEIAAWQQTTSEGRAAMARIDGLVDGFDEMNRREQRIGNRARRVAEYWLTRAADALEPKE
jgi:hypothetical protein